MANKPITLKRNNSGTVDNLYPKTTWDQIETNTIPDDFNPSSHTHGNITNGGEITTNVAIASGDRLVISDTSDSSKLKNSSITFGTGTTTFLRNDGTWATISADGGKATTLDGIDSVDFKNNTHTSHSANDLAVGWYTIATNTGDRAIARFGLRDTDSGRHQSVVFYAAHHFGTNASNTITVLHQSSYGTTPFRYIRIKEGSTYDGAALQVYIDNAQNNVSVFLLGDNFQASGWVLKDWVGDAIDPGDLTNYSSFGERGKIDLDNIAQGGMATTGEIYAGGDTTQYKVWHAGNDGASSGLDADTLDTYQASQFVRSDANDTMTGDLTISNTQPRLILTDTNNNSDFHLQNHNGIFTIGDTTNQEDRFEIDSSGNVDILSGDLSVYGNILLTGDATTTNQGRLIDFTGFDKEGTTDFSDRAYIQHTTNTGGHSGSVLVISSQNDASDGIAFQTNSSSKLKHNGNNVLTTADSYVSADTSGTTDFPRLVVNNSGATYPNWIRVPSNSHGILPYSNGNSYIGTSSWRFAQIHGVNIYENGTALSSKYAPLASPAFTGNPTAPTATAGDADTTIATTAFVSTAISNLVNGASESFNTLKEIQDAMATDTELANAINGLTIGNGTQTITAGSNLSGGGSFTANQTGNSSVTLNVTTGWWDAIPRVGNDGVMEVGKYIDFHQSSTDTSDYAPRLTATNSSNLAINGNTIWHAGNDGSGSGLDADTLDGVQGSSYLRSDADDTMSGILTFGPNSTWSKYLKIGGNANHSDANTGSIGVTNGNLHIDAATGNATYLNYYDGTTGIAFGSGASSVVAWMGPDGDLWKGSSDNTGSKYWHAGNDGSGSGLDADTLDGVQGSSFLRSDANDTASGNYTFTGYHTGNTQFYGTNTTGVYSSAPIEIREVNLVTTNQSSSAYAPGLAFHWGGRVQTQIKLHSDGNLNLSGNQTGRLLTTADEGSGNGLDADTLDGSHASAFASSSHNHSATEIVTGEMDTARLGSGTATSGYVLKSDGDGTASWQADSNTTYSTATSSTLGLVKIGYTENGKNYPVELSSGQMFVNVPWTDNNTTYSAAGTGLSLSGTTFQHGNTSSQASVNNSGRTYIQDITLDDFGHITGITSATETVVDTNTVTQIRKDNTGTYRTGNINLIGGAGVTITEVASGAFSFAASGSGSGITGDDVEWAYVGKSTDSQTGTSITVDSTDLGESYDWANYDYKFVYQGSTTGEDTSMPYIRFDGVSTSNKYSYQYVRWQQTADLTETRTVQGDANTSLIYTGLSLSSFSSGGFGTDTELEFTVRRSGTTGSGMYGFLVRGEGNVHYWPTTQTLSTAYDGMAQTSFVGSFRQDSAITSMTITHQITAGGTDTNIVRVYKRRRT